MMRVLWSAILVLAPASVAGIRNKEQEITSSAIVPLDLGDYELGWQLNLLFNVAESDAICGPSTVKINGQHLDIDRDGTGRGTFLEDYGSQITAAWTVDCIEADGEPLKQRMNFVIEEIDGETVPDVQFAVHFRQVAPVAILDFDGAASEGRVIDGAEAVTSERPTYWELFGEEVVGEEDDEVEVARAEIEYLRLQRQDIDERIADLRDFVRMSGDAGEGQCSSFWCWLKSLFRSMFGSASRSFHEATSSTGQHGWISGRFGHGHHHHHHGHHGGNHTRHGNETHPPHKRPHWMPPFCRLPPHHPKKPHPTPPTPSPMDPSAVPHHPHQSYKPVPPMEPEMDDRPPMPVATQVPEKEEVGGSRIARPQPTSERPLGGLVHGSSPPTSHPSISSHEKFLQQISQRGRIPFTVKVSLEICLIALVLLALTGAIHRCATRRTRRRQQVLRNALREHCRRLRSERRAARAEARRRRKELVKAWFLNVFYRITGQLGDAEKMGSRRLDDEEQQRQEAVVPSDESGQSGDEREGMRRSRAESVASNTMEQDIAQFREVVGLVDGLLGGGDRSRSAVGGEVARNVSIHQDAGPVPPHMLGSTTSTPQPIPIVTTPRPGFVNYAVPMQSHRQGVFPAPPMPPRQEPRRSVDEESIPPPAYESEDEVTLVSGSMVADGFRYMSGQEFTAGGSSNAGGPHSSADELGYDDK